MNVLSLNALLNALWGGAWLLLFSVPALLVYGYLADGVFFEGRGKVRSGNLDEVDAVICCVLMLLLGMLIFGGFYGVTQLAKRPVPTARQMESGVVLSTGMFLVIIGGILGSMIARKLPWREALGLGWFNPAKTILWATLMIVLALPLVTLALTLTQWLFATGTGGDDGSQEIVRFLSTSRDHTARLVVAASAVLIAPVQEEFIFRGFVYGVVRRYAGPVVGLIVNASFFAGIHLHAPSLGGLFMLAACLTLAYEWTGSLYVPMVMHGLFNSLSIVQLLTGSNG